MESTHTIKGTISNLHTLKEPSNLRIEVWDGEQIHTSLIDSSITDTEGNFSFELDSAYLEKLSLKENPDLSFRIYDGEQFIEQMGADAIWSPDITDPLQIEVDIKPDLIQLVKSPVLVTEQLLEISDFSNQTLDEIKTANSPLFNTLTSKRNHLLKAYLLKEFDEVSFEVKELFVNSELADLTDDDAIKSQLDQLITTAGLPEDVVTTTTEIINTLTIPEDLKLDSDTPLHLSPLFKTELRSAAAYRLAKHSGIKESIVDELLTKDLFLGEMELDGFQQLQSDGIITEREQETLIRDLDFARWANGDFNLIKSMTQELTDKYDLEYRGLQDLAHFTRSELISVLERDDIEIPNNKDKEIYATFLAKKIEAQFPDAVVLRQYSVPESYVIERNMDLVNPLLTNNEEVFGDKAFDDLDVSGQGNTNLPDIKTAYNELLMLSKRFPALKIKAILNDTASDSPSKYQQIKNRIGLINTVQQLNPDKSLLGINFGIDSEEFNELDFGAITDLEKDLIRNTLTINQQVYSITRDAEDTMRFIENGYTSVLDIARSTPDRLSYAVDFEPAVAAEYLKEAHAYVPKIVANFATVQETRGDQLLGLGGALGTDKTDINDYLKRLNIDKALFGNRNYCQCEHCSSIISPAAYFTDLMGFITGSVIDPTFTYTGKADSPLNLEKRRGDLWNGLVLSCDNTHTLTPYLTIILEILENYIVNNLNPEATDTNGNVLDANVDVYKTLYESEDLDDVLKYKLNSFEQPFMLPLIELETYLEHFSLSREKLAYTLLKYQESDATTKEKLLPQLSLKLSQKAFNIIEQPIIDIDWLSNLYNGYKFDVTGDQVDTQLLIKPMNVTRTELTDIVNSRFVNYGTSPDLEIKSLKKDSNSLQNDKEVLENITVLHLDRIHRLTRLWRALPWSINELDLVLTQLNIEPDNPLSLASVSNVLSAQKAMDLPIEQICALFSPIPVYSIDQSQEALFNRLFNNGHSTLWSADGSSNGKLYHPNDLPDDAKDKQVASNTYIRLLSGLGIDDVNFWKLFTYLVEQQEVIEITSPQGAKPFYEVTLKNLSILYRHIVLSSVFGFSVDELILFLDINPFPYTKRTNLDNLNKLLQSYQWWKKSGYSLDDMRDMTSSDLSKSEKVADNIIKNIDNSQRLTFSDMIFADVDGITEEQSKEIIKKNPDFVAIQNTSYFVVKGTDVNPAQAFELSNLSIPNLNLDNTSKLEITNKINEFLASYRKKEAPPIGLSGTELSTVKLTIGNKAYKLSEEQSLFIVKNSPDVFTASINDTNLYRLSSGYDVKTFQVDIPDTVPLYPEIANEIIKNHSLNTIIMATLSSELSASVNKINSISLLIGENQFDESIEFLKGNTTDKDPFVKLIHKLSKLLVLFKSRTFSSQNLYTVKEILSVNFYSDLNFQKIKLTSVVKNIFRKKRSKKQSTDVLLSVLNGFATAFDNNNVQPLADYLGVELSAITSINNSITYPNSNNTDLLEHRLYALDKLIKCTELARTLGVSAESLKHAISESYDEIALASKAIVSSFYTKYPLDEVQKKLEPFDDRIREKKRDALTDYIIHSTTPETRFMSKSDLYYWFLIDTELEGCARTSRLVAAISSLQLYVHRCLMNLEQNHDGTIAVDSSKIDRGEWAWRKNYRVWEANRKVFLYPENYIEPELRDDKTPLFKAFETELLQQEISEKSVKDAYLKYITGFVNLNNVEYSGSYQDGNFLHLILVTRTEPIIHYYRRIEGLNNYDPDNPEASPLHWGTMEKIKLQIPVKKVSPIIYRNQLYLFWVQYSTRPMNKMVDGSNVFSGYKHEMKISFSFQEVDGGWSVSKVVTEKGSHVTKKINDNRVINYSLKYKIISEIKNLILEFENLKKSKCVKINKYILLKISTHNIEYEIHQKLIGIIPHACLRGYKVKDISKKINLETFMSHDVNTDILSASEINGFKEHIKKVILEDFYKTYINDSENNFYNRIMEIYNSIELSYNKDIVSFNKEINAKHKGYVFVFNFSDVITVQYDKDYSNHYETNDNYTLSGYKWDRVYPEVYNGSIAISCGLPLEDNKINHTIDLFNSTFKERVSDKKSSLSYLNYLISDSTNLYFTRSRTAQYNVNRYLNTTEVINNNKIWEKEFNSDPVGKELIKYKNTNNISMNVINNNHVSESGVLELNNTISYIGTDSIYESIYFIKRLSTAIPQDINETVFSSGIDSLLGEFQRENLYELPYNFENLLLHKQSVENQDSVFNGSFSINYRELFFFIPYLIANHLNAQGKYEEAQKWYHYILDPTAPLYSHEDDTPEDMHNNKKNRVWRYSEFREHSIKTLKENLSDSTAIEAYERDPFNPHSIARLRLGAYKKNILMKYIDNLLDWGDELFGQDTMESINEASLLYIVAADLLGERPQELGHCRDAVSDTYETLLERAEEKQAIQDPDFLIVNPNKEFGGYGYSNQIIGQQQSLTYAGIYQQFPSSRHNMIQYTGIIGRQIEGLRGRFEPEDFCLRVNGGAAFHDCDKPGILDSLKRGSGEPPRAKEFKPSFHLSFLTQAKYFCIPHNKNLLEYWDRVGDRLFKIRNCQNISGIKRELPLFAPEIDPMLLVRAKAAGMSLDDVLGNLNSDLPPYRFSYLIEKAKEYARALQGFGGALYNAIERKDSEELARLRSMHQQNMLNLTEQSRENEYAAAKADVISLKQRHLTVSKDKEHYCSLVENGKTPWEITDQVSRHTANATVPATVAALLISGQIGLIPHILGLASSTGSKEGSNSIKVNGYLAPSITSKYIMQLADSAGLEGRHQRTIQQWKHQCKQLDASLVEIERQLVTSEIRQDLAKKAIRVHEESKLQEQEISDFYNEKYANQGMDMYIWLANTSQKLYRDVYESTLSLAKLAERAYRFERNDNSSNLLASNYWNSQKSGFLAGDRLLADLMKLETRYIETNYRGMEIRQTFSLSQIQPELLIALKRNGVCTYTIPELALDLVYPGQYNRRIKSVSMSIPCVTGPYTNVSATLSLVESKLRPEAKSGASHLLHMPPTRTVSIATSSAQNDAGVFQLDFNDSRYMPFEGAGVADSKWKLSLPKKIRQFDYTTISDVLLHINYTADYDDEFKDSQEGGSNQASEGEKSLADILYETEHQRVFSLKYEFPDNYQKLLNDSKDNAVSFSLTEKHFPYYLIGMTRKIESAQLALRFDEKRVTSDSKNLSLEFKPMENLLATEVEDNTIKEFLVSGAVGISEFVSLDVSYFKNNKLSLRMTDAGDFANNEGVNKLIDTSKIKDLFLLIKYKVEDPSV